MALPVIGVLGRGRFGSALTHGLRKLGYKVAEAGRGVFEQPAMFQRWVERCEVLCLAVRDDQLEGVARALKEGPLAGKTVVMHAGTVPLGLLQPLAERGAVIGKFHALQAFTRVTREPPPPGTPFAVEGPIHDLVAPWVKGWQGVLHELESDQWERYHLAAVTAANFLALLIRGGAGVLEPLARDRAEALTWLEPLVRRSVEDALDPTIEMPYSGPAIRGDQAVIVRQEAMLADIAPELLPVYREAAAAVLRKGKDEA